MLSGTSFSFQYNTILKSIPSLRNPGQILQKRSLSSTFFVEQKLVTATVTYHIGSFLSEWLFPPLVSTKIKYCVLFKTKQNTHFSHNTCIGTEKC